MVVSIEVQKTVGCNQGDLSKANRNSENKNPIGTNPKQYDLGSDWRSKLNDPTTLDLNIEYSRWTSLNCRCQRMPGGVAMNVCTEWRGEPYRNGFKNYVKWLTEKVAEFKLSRPLENLYVVTRIDKSKWFSPDNCKLVTPAELAQSNVKNGFEQLDYDTVVYARRFAAIHRNIPLAEMALMFGITNYRNFSKAIRGVTWKNANKDALPVEKRVNQFIR